MPWFSQLPEKRRLHPVTYESRCFQSIHMSWPWHTLAQPPPVKNQQNHKTSLCLAWTRALWLNPHLKHTPIHSYSRCGALLDFGYIRGPPDLPAIYIEIARGCSRSRRGSAFRASNIEHGFVCELHICGDATGVENQPRADFAVRSFAIS